MTLTSFAMARAYQQNPRFLIEELVKSFPLRVSKYCSNMFGAVEEINTHPRQKTAIPSILEEIFDTWSVNLDFYYHIEAFESVAQGFSTVCYFRKGEVCLSRPWLQGDPPNASEMDVVGYLPYLCEYMVGPKSMMKKLAKIGLVEIDWEHWHPFLHEDSYYVPGNLGHTKKVFRAAKKREKKMESAKKLRWKRLKQEAINALPDRCYPF